MGIERETTMNSKETQAMAEQIALEAKRMQNISKSDRDRLTTYHIASLLAQVAQLAQYIHQEQD